MIALAGVLLLAAALCARRAASCRRQRVEGACLLACAAAYVGLTVAIVLGAVDTS